MCVELSFSWIFFQDNFSGCAFFFGFCLFVINIVKCTRMLSCTLVYMYCKMYCFGQEHIFTTLSCDVFLFQFPFKQIECMEEWEGSLFSK